MAERDRKKLLYVASTASHLCQFHRPYLNALRESADVMTMASGEGVDYPISFEKRMLSLKNLGNILQIRRILRKERFDAVILNTTLAAALTRLAMLGFRPRPFVLNLVHGYLFSIKKHGMRDHLLLLCEQLLSCKTDAIAVMNAEDFEIARRHRLCRGRLHFIRGMGVSIPQGAILQNREIRRAFLRAPDEHLAVYAGELSARKNQQLLIRAVEQLKKKGSKLRLLLLGDGAEREALQKMISMLDLTAEVFLIGAVSEVLPYLCAADFYLSASRSEGLPFNVMEAMAVGLPIAASEVKGQTDLLAESEALLYPAENLDALCDAVERMIASGVRGVGSCRYPQLSRYRLCEVFDENLAVLRDGWERIDENQ